MTYRYVKKKLSHLIDDFLFASSIECILLMSKELVRKEWDVLRYIYSMYSPNGSKTRMYKNRSRSSFFKNRK